MASSKTRSVPTSPTHFSEFDGRGVDVCPSSASCCEIPINSKSQQNCDEIDFETLLNQLNPTVEEYENCKTEISRVRSVDRDHLNKSAVLVNLHSPEIRQKIVPRKRPRKPKANLSATNELLLKKRRKIDTSSRKPPFSPKLLKSLNSDSQCFAHISDGVAHDQSCDDLIIDDDNPIASTSAAADEAVIHHDDEMLQLSRLIDRKLERSAKTKNLTPLNVKTILHHMILNEHMLPLIRNALFCDSKVSEDPVGGEDVVGAQTELTGGGESNVSAAIDNGLGDSSGIDELRMTRSRTRDLIQNGKNVLWPITPLKEPPPVKTFLDFDYSDNDSNDDDYEPAVEDDTIEGSDAEATITPRSSFSEDTGLSNGASGRSRFSCLSTPQSSIADNRVSSANKTPLDTPQLNSNVSTFVCDPITTAPPDQLPRSTSFVVPFAPKPVTSSTSQPNHCRNLTKAFSRSSPAKHTRSKHSLRNVPLEELEATLNDPDLAGLTVEQIRDFCNQVEDDDTDFDYVDFLYKTTRNEELNESREDDDPDFNFMDELVPPDADDFRHDRATRVPRHEVLDLLCDLIDECKQSDSVPSSTDETITGQPTDAQKNGLLLANAFSDFTPQASDVFDSLDDDSLSLPRQPTVNAEDPGSLLVSDDFLPQITSPQKLSIADQMRQHVQLLTQLHTLAKFHPQYEHEAVVAENMLKCLQSLSCDSPIGKKSMFAAWNLPHAMKAVEMCALDVNSLDAYTAINMSTRSTKKRWSRNYAAVPKLGWYPSRIIANSKAFLYPQLLPTVGLLPKEKIPLSMVYSESEKRLVLLGYIQFENCVRKDRLIREHLLPHRSSQSILKHIKNCRQNTQVSNELRRYIDEKIIPDFSVAPLNFNPDLVVSPLFWPARCLPDWLKCMKFKCTFRNHKCPALTKTLTSRALNQLNEDDRRSVRSDPNGLASKTDQSACGSPRSCVSTVDDIRLSSYVAENIDQVVSGQNTACLSLWSTDSNLTSVTPFVTMEPAVRVLHLQQNDLPFHLMPMESVKKRVDDSFCIYQPQPASSSDGPNADLELLSDGLSTSLVLESTAFTGHGTHDQLECENGGGTPSAMTWGDLSAVGRNYTPCGEDDMVPVANSTALRAIKAAGGDHSGLSNSTGSTTARSGVSRVVEGVNETAVINNAKRQLRLSSEPSTSAPIVSPMDYSGSVKPTYAWRPQLDRNSTARRKLLNDSHDETDAVFTDGSPKMKRLPVDNFNMPTLEQLLPEPDPSPVKLATPLISPGVPVHHELVIRPQAFMTPEKQSPPVNGPVSPSDYLRSPFKSAGKRKRKHPNVLSPFKSPAKIVRNAVNILRRADERRSLTAEEADSFSSPSNRSPFKLQSFVNHHKLDQIISPIVGSETTATFKTPTSCSKRYNKKRSKVEKAKDALVSMHHMPSPEKVGKILAKACMMQLKQALYMHSSKLNKIKDLANNFSDQCCYADLIKDILLIFQDSPKLTESALQNFGLQMLSFLTPSESENLGLFEQSLTFHMALDALLKIDGYFTGARHASQARHTLRQLKTFLETEMTGCDIDEFPDVVRKKFRQPEFSKEKPLSDYLASWLPDDLKVQDVPLTSEHFEVFTTVDVNKSTSTCRDDGPVFETISPYAFHITESRKAVQQCLQFKSMLHPGTRFCTCKCHDVAEVRKVMQSAKNVPHCTYCSLKISEGSVYVLNKSSVFCLAKLEYAVDKPRKCTATNKTTDYDKLNLIDASDLANNERINEFLPFVEQLEGNINPSSSITPTKSLRVGSNNSQQKPDLLRMAIYECFGNSNMGLSPSSSQSSGSLHSNARTLQYNNTCGNSISLDTPVISSSSSRNVFIHGKEGMKVMFGNEAINELKSNENSLMEPIISTDSEKTRDWTYEEDVKIFDLLDCKETETEVVDIVCSEFNRPRAEVEIRINYLASLAQDV